MSIYFKLLAMIFKLFGPGEYDNFIFEKKTYKNILKILKIPEKAGISERKKNLNQLREKSQ
jgi:hypothetical protein